MKKKNITNSVLSDIVRLHFLSINGGIWTFNIK
jgi:hypothetical protein